MLQRGAAEDFPSQWLRRTSGSVDTMRGDGYGIMVVRKRKYFVDGKCVLCATEECNDFCHHYGAVVCRRTLKKMGEALYLKGQDELVEYGVGNKFKSSIATIFKSIKPQFEFVAWFICIVVFLIVTYYMVIIGWDAVLRFFRS